MCHIIYIAAMSFLKIIKNVIHLLNFFLNSIHDFGLVLKEKLFEGDMRQGHPTAVFRKISVRGSKCCLEFSVA